MSSRWNSRWEATVEEYIQQRTTRAENGCLLWRGAKPGRVGWFQYKGMFKSTSATICVYTARVGTIPEGKILRHSCDDPRCVEISHLIPGTKKENRQDFMERHPRAMELCLTAIKLATVGVKKRWDSMTCEEREYFVNRRAAIQRAKYPKGHPMHQKKVQTARKNHPKGSPSQKQKVLTLKKNYPDGHPMYKKRGIKIWETRRRNGTVKLKAKT